MIRVVNQPGVVIKKNSLCFFEGKRHVSPKLDRAFALIPGKFNIAHSIILAIPGTIVLGGPFLRTSFDQAGFILRMPPCQRFSSPGEDSFFSLASLLHGQKETHLLQRRESGQRVGDSSQQAGGDRQEFDQRTISFLEEDGRPQTIRYFSQENRPAADAGPAGGPPA